MSLHLIPGNSGGGKTHTLYETVIREACAFPDRNFLVLVPEQFTLETQRELVAMHPGHSLCNIDILSFARLGHRLLEEAGIDDRRVLDDTAKNMILRRIAGRRRGELKILGANLDRMGMIDELKSFICELMQYNLAPDDLDRMIDEAQHETLKRKLEDVRLIYADFLSEIEGKALTAESLLTQMGHLAGDSALIRDSVIALDGYTGFTPVQNTLLSSLMRSAGELYVTVTIDVTENLTRRGEMSDLFYLSRRTIRQLLNMARENGTEVSEPVFCTAGREYRYQDAPQIRHLEQHLFRGHSCEAAVYERGEGEEAQILVCACTDPRDELEYILRRIRRSVSGEGASYGDFAVMTGDLSRYENFAQALFSDYEIPYFLDRTRRLDAHPFPQALSALVRIISDDFSYRSVFVFLRSGFGPFDTDQTDRLENHVLAAGIRGYSAWKREWKRNPLRLDEHSLKEINDLRQSFIDGITPLRDAFRDRNSDITEKTMALYRYLTQQQAEEKLAARAQMFRDLGRIVQAREEEQIYPLTMQVLEKLTGELGETDATAESYRELLEAGFSATTLRVAPPRKDTVVFGDMERTRLNHVKTLFLIGVNDGVIPGTGAEGGILSEFERRSLKEAGEELAYTAREQILVQNFYLYQNLTKPEKRLVMTYAMRSSDGTALRRSALISSIEKLYADPLTEQAAADDPQTLQSSASGSMQALTPASALMSFAKQTAQIADDWEKGDGRLPQVSSEWSALAAYYQKTAGYESIPGQLLTAACGGTEDSRLCAQTARSLYGSVLQGSVSRLERYAACAFSHFAQYGLGLRERKAAAFEAPDMGNLLHDAIRNYTQRVRETGKTFHDLSAEEIDHYAQLAMDMALSEHAQDPAFESAVNRQIVQRLRRVFHRTAHIVTEQVQCGSFEPVRTEVPFHMLCDLNEGRKMRLNGRIDRVDAATAEKYRPLQADINTGTWTSVRIIDYKSSKKAFRPEELYYGLSLQLPLYLAAVTEEASHRQGSSAGDAGEGGSEAGTDDVLAAGMFYYAMIDPLLDEVPDETQEEHRRRVKKELRLTGAMNEHPEALKAMDDLPPGAESDVVKLVRKKDGGIWGNRSEVLPQQDFNMLPDYARKKAAEIGNAIADGDIRVSPYRAGQYTSCQYCPYPSVCGFDAKRAQYRFRNAELSKEEALSKMKEELS